jgi:hypothetical protein
VLIGGPIAGTIMSSFRLMPARLLLVCLIGLLVISAPADADAVPAGGDGQALAFLDAYFREPVSMPDLVWSSLLQTSAQHHAAYWAANHAYTVHGETPGTPGFTGVDPESRCEAVGAPPCGEVAFSELDVVDAMQGWMQTPYHGGVVLASSELGCGSAAPYGSVCDVSGSPTLVTSNSSAAANAPDSPVRIWPYDGAIGIPVQWTGGETPDPLASYARHSRSAPGPGRSSPSSWLCRRSRSAEPATRA